MKMKRFMVWVGADYYPNTPEGDFMGSYDTMEEAQAAQWPEEWERNWKGDWRRICDTETSIWYDQDGDISPAGHEYES